MIAIETKQAEEQAVKPFPKLMIGEQSGSIVYFKSERCGIRLQDMYYSTGWYPADFKDYNEEVTIKIRNDE